MSTEQMAEALRVLEPRLGAMRRDGVELLIDHNETFKVGEVVVVCAVRVDRTRAMQASMRFAAEAVVEEDRFVDAMIARLVDTTCRAADARKSARDGATE